MSKLPTWVFTIKDPVAMAGFPIPPLAVGSGVTREQAAQVALKSLSKLADLHSAPAEESQCQRSAMAQQPRRRLAASGWSRS